VQRRAGTALEERRDERLETMGLVLIAGERSTRQRAPRRAGSYSEAEAAEGAGVGAMPRRVRGGPEYHL
jgi:hypothetical protein